MGVRVSRGCLVVALLVFVNLQLLILVMRSEHLSQASEQPQFTLATVTRENHQEQQRIPPVAPSPSLPSLAASTISHLRGVPGTEPQKVHSGKSSAKSQYKNNEYNHRLFDPPSNLNALLAVSSTAAAAGSAYEATALPRPVRPVRPAGRWVRQVAGTGDAYSLTDPERDALAASLGARGANATTQIAPRFVRLPDWLTDPATSRVIQSNANTGSSEFEEGEEVEDAVDVASADVPCLFSESTGHNVFLVAAATPEWEALQTNSATGPLVAELLSGKRRCPKPRAGQQGDNGRGRPEVSFIIPMHDHVSITLECLLNLLRYADEIPSAEYVLVDDGSLEDVEEIRQFLKHMKESFGIRVKFHRQHLGVGYASIMTQASRLAEGRYLMLLNNDVMMTSGALQALYAAASDHPNAGVVVPQFVQMDGRLLDAGGIIFTDASAWQYGRGVPSSSPEAHPYAYVRDVDYGTAACLLISRELFLDLGMYDPRYAEDKGAYYEDTDMSFHVRQAGYRVLYTPFASVLHYESVSYGDQSSSAPDKNCNNNGKGCTSSTSSSGSSIASPGSSAVSMPVTVSSTSSNSGGSSGGGGAGAKKALMSRGKAKFSGEWNNALTCTFLHKSVGSQLDAFVPATRLSTLRVLVAVDVNHANALLCGGPKGPGLGGRPKQPASPFRSAGSSDISSSSTAPPAATDADFRRVFGDGGLLDGFARLRLMLETLLAAQVHVTIVLTGHEFYSGSAEDADEANLGASSRRRGCAFQKVEGCPCAAHLRYLGIHVVPNVDLLVYARKPTKLECRFDAVLVAGVSPYRRLLLDLRDKCPLAPVVFDTPDLTLLRDARHAKVPPAPSQTPQTPQAQAPQSSPPLELNPGASGGRQLMIQTEGAAAEPEGQTRRRSGLLNDRRQSGSVGGRRLLYDQAKRLAQQERAAQLAAAAERAAAVNAERSMMKAGGIGLSGANSVAESESSTTTIASSMSSLQANQDGATGTTSASTAEAEPERPRRLFSGTIAQGELMFVANSAVTVVASSQERLTLLDQRRSDSTSSGMNGKSGSSSSGSNINYQKSALDQQQGGAVVVVPRPIALRPTMAPFARRSGLLFVGDLYAPHDLDALLWFVDHVLTPLRNAVMEDAAGAFALTAAANAADVAAAAAAAAKDSPSANGASFDGGPASSSPAAPQANVHSSAPSQSPPSGMLGYELALARALAAAAEDVVLHVVQLNGRPLPPPHMLPPRLLRLNASSLPSSSSSSSDHSPASSFTTGEAAGQGGSKAFESAGNEPLHTRMVVLHDVWRLAHHTRGNSGSRSISYEWRATKPPLETTTKHQEVIQHAAAASRAASQLAALGNDNTNEKHHHSQSSADQQSAVTASGSIAQNWFNSLWSYFLGETSATAENMRAQEEGSNAPQMVLQGLHTTGRGLVVVVKFVAKLGWAGGYSLMFGTPFDWQWASQDLRRATRKAKRSLKAWWAGLTGAGADDQTSSSDGRRTSSSHGRSDSSWNNVGDDDDVAVDDDASTGTDGFAGFGAGSAESGLEALDKLFRNTRLAVLPQRHTPGAFDQVVASLSRGVPLVLTSAAVAGAPGDPFAQGDNGAVPSPSFFAKQAQNLQTILEDERRQVDQSAFQRFQQSPSRPPISEPENTASEDHSAPTGASTAPPYIVANSADDFVSACRNLYGSPTGWASVAAAGYATLQQEASVPAVVTATAELLTELLAAPPTTMASAAAAAQGSSAKSGVAGAGLGSSGKGHSSFSQRIEFGRRALAMQGCSNAHTSDLLTFSSGA